MLLTPMMMHPWMKFTLLMLMMSMLIIMIMNYDNTDDDHDNNYDLYGRACNARVNTSIYINMFLNKIAPKRS